MTEDQGNISKMFQTTLGFLDANAPAAHTVPSLEEASSSERRIFSFNPR
jgi:hypothetical protein